MNRRTSSLNASDRLPRYALGALAVMSTAGFWLCSDERTRLLAANTIRLAVGTCLISLPVAIVLSWLLFRTDLPGRRVVTSLLIAMVFVPLYLQTAAWDAGFGLQGWFQFGYGEAGSTPLLHGWRGAIWIHAVAAIPWSMLIIAAGLHFLPVELEEQALLDATPLVTFWHVTLPRVTVSLVVAALWILVSTAGEITVTDVFQVRTFAEELYVGFALGDQVDGGGLVATQIGVLSGVTVLGCLVAAALGVSAYLVPPDDTSGYGSPRVFELGRLRWPMALLVMSIVLCVVGLPIGNLVYKAGVTVQQLGDHRLRDWSLSKMLQMVATSPWRFRHEMLWSLLIANLVALLTTALAIPLAWLARPRGWTSVIVLLVLAICLAMPGPMIGLTLIQLLNRPQSELLTFLYDQSLLAPCAALFLRALPLVTMIVWYGLRTIPAETLESAELDGAGPVARLILIALPQRLAVLAAGYLAAMAIAMGDLAATILVVPPGVTTLSIRIFNLIHYGVEDRLAGICLATFAIFVLLAGTAMTMMRPSRS